MAISVTPFLWYQEKALEAATFYASLIPDSRVGSVYSMPVDTPSGPPGSVEVVEFTLAGRSFTAMGCSGPDTFNHSVSFSLGCDTQAEIDRFWDALLEGGSPEQCGWLRDRYGLAWQIVPNRIADWTMGSDKEGAKRAAQAMMRMVKLDIATLEAAYEGESA